MDRGSLVDVVLRTRGASLLTASVSSGKYLARSLIENN